MIRMNRSFFNPPEVSANRAPPSPDRLVRERSGLEPQGREPRGRFVEVLDPPDRFDLAIEAILVLLLAFMPLAFGGVEPWAQAIIFLLIGVAGLCLMLKLALRPGARIVRSWAYLPILLFLVVVGAQLLPLPAGVLKVVSPATVEIKTRLLADLPDAPRLLRTMTLSFYPHATRQTLRIVLTAAAVFTLVVNVYRRPEQVKRILIAITLIGALVALIALAQDFTRANAIYWDGAFQPFGGYRATSGPFVNYNNFSQYMNLSMGAALGLLVLYFTEWRAEARHRFPEAHHDLVRRRGLVMAGLGAFILAGAFCIFFSGSRGGMMSLLVAMTLTTLLLASRRASGAAGWALGGAMVLISIGVLYVGFDTVYARLGSLQNLQKASPMRWETNKDVWAMWPRFRIAGVGLGGHEMVYPMFARAPQPGLSEQLENDYLQLLEETGLLGAACFLLFLIAIAPHFVKALRRTERPRYAVIFGLGYGLIAVLIHSCTDFGQRLPANACLTAVFFGLIVNLGRRRSEPGAPAEPVAPPTPGARRLRWAMLVPAFLLWGWMLLGSGRAALADAFAREARPMAQDLADHGWQGSDDEYKKLLARADDVCFVEPADVKARFFLANCRWHYVSRVYDETRTHILLSADQLNLTRQLVTDLRDARAVCPTFGPILCELGQIELFVFKDPAGAGHIRTGYLLAPSHPVVCFVAGRLDAREKQWDASLEEFRRAIALAHPVGEILRVYVDEVDRPDLALRLINDNRGALMFLADMLDKSRMHSDVRDTAVARAQEILLLDAAREDASPDTLASVAAQLYKEKRYAAAIEKYRMALDSNEANPGWHYALALVLRDSGDIESAKREARISLRFSPGSAQATKLLEQLALMPSTKPAN